DFVEAPSQMFEEWAWKRETLDVFARQYQTGQKLPEDLFQAMIQARTFGEATAVERQIFLSSLDQIYHTREPGFDTTEVMETLHHEFSSFTRIPHTCFQTAFGHLVGYDAAYYGYQWARSLAFDLLTRFEAEGMLNTVTAAAYCKEILAPGSSADENVLVYRFLGREANAQAYKRFLGIAEPLPLPNSSK
ncbi:oligopeptidase A, partial [Candidatus Uhrbacteria bacterium]|nr:oligopeptidase A [Candidatus Uhrbacteria bacterium]